MLDLSDKNFKVDFKNCFDSHYEHTWNNNKIESLSIGIERFSKEIEDKRGTKEKF